MRSHKVNTDERNWVIEARPSDNRLARRIATALVLVAILAIGFSLLRPAPEIDPTAYPAGRTSDLQPRGPQLVEITYPFDDPTVLEGNEPPTTVGTVASAVAWISLIDDEPVALLSRSPWLGCRLVVATAADAADFGYAVDADFTGFLDPCHGGLYSATGEHLDGPGSADLTRIPARVAGGSILLDLEAATVP